MTIKFTKTIKLENNDINTFETTNCLKLPTNFKNFILKFNGGILENNIFEVGNENNCSINQFIPLSEMIKKQKILGILT